MIVFDFIEKYYIEPIKYGTGYNIYNTLTYAIILIAAALLVFKALKKLGIKIDDKFMIGVVPYIALGGIFRALQDAGVLQSWLFITPLIYFVIFALAFASLLVAVTIQRYKKTGYHKTWFAIGALFCLAGLLNIKIADFFPLFAIVSITLGWSAALFAVKKVISKRTSSKISAKKAGFFSHTNILVILVHMFDASTTFVALYFYGYFEQHVVPSFVIGVLGPASMFAMKLVVLIPVLFLLDKDLKKEKEKRTFIKMIIVMLGLAPGIRNMLRLVMGV